MVNTITLLQQYIECCEMHHIKSPTPEGFLLTLKNELACTFLIDYMLKGGYSEENIEDYIQSSIHQDYNEFVVEVGRAWVQLNP